MGSGASSQSWQRRYFLTTNGPATLEPGEPYSEVYPVYAIAVTKNQKQLAAATGDNKICLWCLTNYILLISLSGHAETIWQLAYSPDDALLASTSADGTVKLWEANTGKLAMTLPRKHSNWVQSLAWSPDGERLATGGSDARVLLWNAADAVEALRKAEFKAAQAETDPAWAESAAYEAEEAARKSEPLVWWPAHEKSVHCLAFAPTDSRMLVTAGAEGTLAIWDAEVGSLDCRLCGNLGRVNCVSINPAMPEAIATGGEDCTVRLWDLRELEPSSASAKLSREQPRGLNLAHFTLRGHDEGVAAVRYTQDGQLLASGSKDCEVRIWLPDLSNPSLLRHFQAHQSWIRDLSWTHDQHVLFTCATDGMVYAWDVPKKYHLKDAKQRKGSHRYAN